MTRSGRTLHSLASEAETVLVEVARAGTDPATYGWLASRLTGSREVPLPARLMGAVLIELRNGRGSRSWAPNLTAFVVNAESNEPGEGYYVTGLGDATQVRDATHRRLAQGVYD